jgi:hypothetical protein
VQAKSVRETAGRSAADDSDGGREALAREAIGAMATIVDLLLELGITSPEAESLLRGLFVHRSCDWLAAQNQGTAPSDVRIALVTGIHRNFVSKLLAEPPSIPAVRRRKGHRANRLLRAWYTEPAYQDGSGKPRDLPTKGPAPSFEALAARYVPSSPAAVVLQELHRAGVVQLLPEQRVRVRSRALRTIGVNIGNIRELARQLDAFSRTLLGNIREPDYGLLCESIQGVEIEESRLSVVREVINRRASGFLQSLQAELAAERRRTPSRNSRRIKLSVTVFESVVQEKGRERG